MVDDIQNSDDTASVFDDLAENSTDQSKSEASPLDDPGMTETAPQQDATPTTSASSTQTAPVGSHTKVDKIDQIKAEIGCISGHIRDLEMLVLARVFHKLHPSYYRSWTSDIRETFNLVTRLNRRKNEIRDKRSGKLPQDYRTG